MNGHELKVLIEAGDYRRPRPEEIAQAMLRRRAVRELLITGSALRADGAPSGPLSAAGRIRSAPESPRQAA